MQNMTAVSSKPEWTLADFLSTYRYWALFLASFLVAAGGRLLDSILPLMWQAAANSHQTVGLYYSGSTVGWAVGAFLAFVIAGRNARVAVLAPIVTCGLVTTGFLLMPALWGSPVFLFLFGLVVGAARSVFPLAVAVFLIAGRPGKIDFASALALLSVPILMSSIAPVGAVWLSTLDDRGSSISWGVIACLLAAMLVLLPAGDLSFDQPPRSRHKPLAPRQRSPLVVALVLIAAPLLLLVIGLGGYLLQLREFDGPIRLLGYLTLVIALLAFIYFVYWVYRIHGELAGAAPSQRLLSPVAATLIAVFVPLGLPVLLMALGDLLNDRCRDNGHGGPISIIWLAIWCLIMPPIAIAMIQNASNKSYGMHSDANGR